MCHTLPRLLAATLLVMPGQDEMFSDCCILGMISYSPLDV